MVISINEAIACGLKPFQVRNVALYYKQMAAGLKSGPARSQALDIANRLRMLSIKMERQPRMAA